MATTATGQQARPRRLLQAIDSADGKPVIRQGSLAPVFRGDSVDGFDYVCGACRETIIIEKVIDGQFWDLVFRCFTCGGLSQAPSSHPGLVLPRTTVVIPPPRVEYYIKGTVNITREVVSAGQDAVKRRANETGSPPKLDPLVVTGSNDVESLIERVQNILGETYNSLAASDERGRRASTTPPRDRHRLMELVEMVRRSAATLDGNSLCIDTAAITELYGAVGLLERWRNDPAWPGIIESLKSPHNFPHVIVTLAAASLLNDIGNRVGIHVEEVSGRRAADLKIAVTLNRRLAVEVKAPKALRTCAAAVDEVSARRIIEKCLKKSGTGANGQLNPNHPGLLLVGAFHLSGRDLDLLERAAMDILAVQGKRKTHMAGIAILWVGGLIEATFPLHSDAPSRPNVQLTPVVFCRLAHNPAYKGELSIETLPTLGSASGSS